MTSIPEGLKLHYNSELTRYWSYIKMRDYPTAWKHLERAHVLGQSFPVEHTKAHWLMLGFAFRIKSIKEIAGQLPRLLTGGIKSFVGKVPIGNTGGADVHPLRKMEIPEDLKSILSTYNVKHQ